jgi:hypothetical protein
MQQVIRSPAFCVYDDVLPRLELEALWRFFERDRFESVHQAGWRSVWRLGDGHPLQGTLVGSSGPAGPLGPVLAAVRGLAAELVDLVGVEGRDWTELTARPFLYPQGSALSWHNDPPPYSGAYVFYAHPEWNVQWGGELLVAHESTRGARLVEHRKSFALVDGELAATGTHALDNHLHNRVENEALSQLGLGHYVFAKPNRLVVLAGGVPHMINRVGPAAGDRVRCSVAGFFSQSATALNP